MNRLAIALDKVFPNAPMWLIKSVLVVLWTACVWTPLALLAAFVMWDIAYFWTWWTRLWLGFWIVAFAILIKD